MSRVNARGLSFMYRGNPRKGSSSATALKAVQKSRKDLEKALRYYDSELFGDIVEEESKKAYAEMIAIVPHSGMKFVPSTGSGNSDREEYQGVGGKLQRSIYCRPTRSKGKFGIVAGASAWDPYRKFNYAGIQHENEEFHHDPPRQAHYISQPLDKYAKIIIQKIIQKNQQLLGGGNR